jgi:hypothetical protein
VQVMLDISTNYIPATVTVIKHTADVWGHTRVIQKVKAVCEFSECNQR